ncbi:hypothetical protein NEOLEDRAFT_391814 [Neolentinus lepideus HHB14362 ss-1]|uniref:Uncharacterized protein n=1 Tax=Neolentinus lepideus HHB14362 ss-1 TaxID=1314782 RepID=A0A165S767_9AGAM|nr:hypothetical protein NEOLEDRAFT_391814 [Neolentinus lepideus HHB14362 ss-1]
MIIKVQRRRHSQVYALRSDAYDVDFPYIRSALSAERSGSAAFGLYCCFTRMSRFNSDVELTSYSTMAFSKLRFTTDIVISTYSVASGVSDLFVFIRYFGDVGFKFVVIPVAGRPQFTSFNGRILRSTNNSPISA